MPDTSSSHSLPGTGSPPETSEAAEPILFDLPPENHAQLVPVEDHSQLAVPVTPPAASANDVELVTGGVPSLILIRVERERQEDHESPQDTGGGAPDDRAEQSTVPLSKLPEERMAAAASWQEIRDLIRAQEEGGPDVFLEPGGQFVVTGSDGSAQPLSKLPQERMAAVNEGPTEADVNLLRRLDPGNVERWEPVFTGEVAGWKFQMTPKYPGQRPFVFFAFRSPEDGNAFRIAPIYPDMDDKFGHRPHMIKVRVGSRKLPIICGPGGRAAATLAEVRTHAAKWMAYTSLRMAGKNPKFSK
ncbi:hypothetical protein GCM10029978_112800 [Actinoallomurus acanthiterrae]